MVMDYFEQGRQDARAYFESRSYSGLSEFIQAEEAIKLFWPPVEESMMLVSMPFPKPRQKWLAGFRQERVTIRAERVIACRTCGQNLPTEEENTDD